MEPIKNKSDIPLMKGPKPCVPLPIVPTPPIGPQPNLPYRPYIKPIWLSYTKPPKPMYRNGPKLNDV